MHSIQSYYIFSIITNFYKILKMNAISALLLYNRTAVFKTFLFYIKHRCYNVNVKSKIFEYKFRLLNIPE